MLQPRTLSLDSGALSVSLGKRIDKTMPAVSAVILDLA